MCVGPSQSVFFPGILHCIFMWFVKCCPSNVVGEFYNEHCVLDTTKIIFRKSLSCYKVSDSNMDNVFNISQKCYQFELNPKFFTWIQSQVVRCVSLYTIWSDSRITCMRESTQFCFAVAFRWYVKYLSLVSMLFILFKKSIYNYMYTLYFSSLSSF